jgi:heme oxygenase
MNRNGKVLYEFKDIDDLTENDFKRIYGENIKVIADEQEPTL